MNTYWFDLVFLEPPLDVPPGLSMYIEVKAPLRIVKPDGEYPIVGHQACSAVELEYYVKQIKAELDEIVAEAHRRDDQYHKKLSAKRRGEVNCLGQSL